MIYYITDNRNQAIHLREIPEVDYAALYEDLKERLTQEQYHVAHYFARPEEQKLRFYLILLDDANAKIMISSFSMEYYEDIALPSLTALHPALHPFEREITELYNVEFDSMPWNKPLRFAFNRRNRNSTIDNYPFYTIEGESLHEVNVGPIHAGIIEPGAFRFICNGENVLHLEIALGYQHRGVENEVTATDNRLRQMLLSESIAGDSAVSHGVAFAMAMEKLSGKKADENLERERTVALELERMAMHIADTGALCTDVGYQLGQVACEALRTMTINTTQAWCGNRFGKSYGIGDKHSTRHLVMLCLGKKVSRNKFRIAGIICNNKYLTGSRDHVNSNLSENLLLCLSDKRISGSHYLVHLRNAFSTVSSCGFIVRFPHGRSSLCMSVVPLAPCTILQPFKQDKSGKFPLKTTGFSDIIILGSY